jgi:hypothetical protein
VRSPIDPILVYGFEMKPSIPGRPQKITPRKKARLERQHKRSALVSKLSKLNRHDLGMLAEREPSLAEALSLVRAKDLEK